MGCLPPLRSGWRAPGSPGRPAEVRAEQADGKADVGGAEHGAGERERHRLAPDAVAVGELVARVGPLRTRVLEADGGEDLDQRKAHHGVVPVGVGREARVEGNGATAIIEPKVARLQCRHRVRIDDAEGIARGGREGRRIEGLHLIEKVAHERRAGVAGHAGPEFHAVEPDRGSIDPVRDRDRRSALCRCQAAGQRARCVRRRAGEHGRGEFYGDEAGFLGREAASGGRQRLDGRSSEERDHRGDGVAVARGGKGEAGGMARPVEAARDGAAEQDLCRLHQAEAGEDLTGVGEVDGDRGVRHHAASGLERRSPDRGGRRPRRRRRGTAPPTTRDPKGPSDAADAPSAAWPRLRWAEARSAAGPPPACPAPWPEGSVA